MPPYLLFATDATGEDASFTEHGATLSDAHARADERLIGTSVRLDPLPAPPCPVRDAYAKLRPVMNGVRGAMALWEAQDELCRDPDPAVMWLAERERCARNLADDMAALSKSAVAMLATVVAMLPPRDQFERSVAHEAADRRETFRAAIAKATL